MGLLDSLQSTLFKQSSVNQEMKRYQQFQEQQQPQFNPEPRRVDQPEQIQRPDAPGQLGGIGATNPFLISNATSLSKRAQNLGVNKPLEQPMFIGYHNDQPIYGGSKLFLLG